MDAPPLILVMTTKDRSGKIVAFEWRCRAAELKSIRFEKVPFPGTVGDDRFI